MVEFNEIFVDIFASVTVSLITESAPRLVKMSSRTMCITQEGPANALALNKDYSQVVIAGRNGNDHSCASIMRCATASKAFPHCHYGIHLFSECTGRRCSISK